MTEQPASLPSSRPGVWALVAVVLSLAAMARLGIGAEALGSIADVLRGLANLTARMWPPRLEAATLADVVRGTGETLSMSVVGTAMGAVIGLALMPLCCETLLVRGVLLAEERRSGAAIATELGLHHAARAIANVLRTVPYFVWALLFWFMVGPGAFAGALALGVHTGGVVARTYSQALDAVDPRPVAALRAIGARRLHILLFGLLPESRVALASLTLYRWEVNLRESAVLGLVGGVGLGFHLKYAIGIFDWRAVATHLAALVLLVLAVDALSTRVRRLLL